MKKLPLFFLTFLCAATGFAAERQPNIILMMADDVSWECFSCYGAEDYNTPNIDRLAAEGARFDHAYSTPICTPSRVKIMTGKYSFRNYTHFGYLDPAERTFGHLLQDAGYQTAIAGKWQLNGIYSSNPGYEDPNRPQKAGFHESLLWQVTREKKDGGERFWEPLLERNGVAITPEENKGKYGPDLETEFLLKFIEQNKDQPFFAYYPMTLVHDPFVPTPDNLEPDQVISPALNKEPKDKTLKKKYFVGMVEYMDKLIGKITAKVDELGLAEDTIIIFTADNGTHPKIKSQWNGQAITGGKGGMKDNGTHVPFVVRWTGKTPAGTVSKDLIDFTDLYATFADASGGHSDKDPVDGRSFLPQLKGETGNPREWVLCHYQPYWGGKTAGQYARTATYKLYRDGRFYNVPVDLDENSDLAKSGQGADVKKELQYLINRLPEVPEGDRNSTERPIYPESPSLFEE